MEEAVASRLGFVVTEEELHTIKRKYCRMIPEGIADLFKLVGVSINIAIGCKLSEVWRPPL
jgi:hypothetical protein